MCEQLQKYISEVRKISISAATRELNAIFISKGMQEVNKETVRTWVKGISVPRPGCMEIVCAWSGNFIQPNHFYDLSEHVRANGHDPVLVLNAGAAA